MRVRYGEAVEGLAEAGASSRVMENLKQLGVYFINQFLLL